MSEDTVHDPQPWHIPRLITAWVIAILTSLAIVFFAPQGATAEWFVVGVAFSVIVTFVLQLGTAQRQGFITRVSFSVVGSIFLTGTVGLCAFLLGAR